MHLLQRGFMPSYVCWTNHWKGVILENNEEEDNDTILDYVHYGSKWAWCRLEEGK
jgi:hypothetical protein